MMESILERWESYLHNSARISKVTWPGHSRSGRISSLLTHLVCIYLKTLLSTPTHWSCTSRTFRWRDIRRISTLRSALSKLQQRGCLSFRKISLSDTGHRFKTYSKCSLREQESSTTSADYSGSRELSTATTPTTETASWKWFGNSTSAWLPIACRHQETSLPKLSKWHRNNYHVWRSTTNWCRSGSFLNIRQWSQWVVTFTSNSSISIETIQLWRTFKSSNQGRSYFSAIWSRPTWTLISVLPKSANVSTEFHSW